MASAKEMLNKTFSGMKDGFHTLMEKIPNNPLLAKENAVEVTLIFIIVIVAILIFFWLYNTFTLSNTNCANLEKIYGSDKINNSLTSITPSNQTKFGGNLVDYYISTAYNCCCAGNFKNDFVDSAYTTPKLCALTNCIKQGARCLDFEIYSYKDSPVIAASSVDSFDIKETFNYLEFDTAFNWLGTIAFNNTFCSNNEDPLIVNLRIMSDNIKIYPMIAQSILKQIPSQHQLDPKYNILNYCNNLCKLPLLTFRNKMIVVIDSNTYNNLNKMCPALHNCSSTSGSTTSEVTGTTTTPITPIQVTTSTPTQPVPSSGVPCLEPNLLEVVHMHSGSPYFTTSRYSTLQLNGDLATIQNVNESLLSLLLPDYNANAKNVNPAYGMGYGCQMVAMCFQTFDANMEYYLTYFNNAGSAFIYKPNYLRYIPQYITLPPALPSSLDLSPKTATVETSLGSVNIATFPNLPPGSSSSTSGTSATDGANLDVYVSSM